MITRDDTHASKPAVAPERSESIWPVSAEWEARIETGLGVPLQTT
jgi:hypothetical protein